MTPYDRIAEARRILGELLAPVTADGRAHVLDADLSLSIAAALLIEGRVVERETVPG